VITDNASDKLDVLSCRRSFIGQVNNVIRWFSKLDCCMKTRLLRAYCFSFYGCELSDLSNLHVQSLCVAWRQALRRIWKLPSNCHAAILERLSGTVSLFDSLCNRSLNFVQKCLNCDNILVNFVSRHAVFYSRMCSVMGRNVQYFCERFGACSLVRQNAQLNDSHHTHGWGCIVHVNTV